MNGNNVKLMGVAAVVIVVCLLFSYLYMDNGSEDRREMQVGDYRIYVDIYEDSDGYRTQNLVTETIVGTDGGTYLIRSDGGLSSTTFYADYEYLHPEFPDEYLVTEEIAVEIPFVGERVCTMYSFEEADGLTIIYVDPDTGDVLYETGMSTSVSTEIIAERVLISDSISMQEPEFGSSTYHTDLTVGDYIAFYASTDVVDGITITYSVETMNDDGTVTFYDDFRERFVTCTVEEFFAGGITGDYVVRGTSLVDQSYVPRLCEVCGYDTDAGYIYTYVGVDDGICYAFKLSDSDGNDTCSATLAYSNMICGDLEIVGQDELSAGDSQTVLTIYSDPEGGVDHSIVVNQVQQVVDGIIAGGIFVDDTYSTSFIGSHVTEPMGDSIGSATLHTVYGELDCDILLTQTNGVTTCLYVHDGIVVYENRITDLGDGRTVSEERMLITDTSLDGTDVTGGRTNLGYVEAGSWFDYNIYINDSPFDSISYDVVSVDGDDAMVSVDGDEPVQMTVYQLLNGYPEGAGLRLIGQSVLETMWGNIVCDVYSLEAQYETYYYIGASDGVNYMTEYMVGEDLYTVYLEGSSTVI